MLTRLRRSIEDKDEGFTLIELLVVVIIIGILAAIAVPLFLNQRKKGYDADAKSDLRNAATAQETWNAEKGSYTMTNADLLLMGFKAAVPGAVLTIISNRTPAVPPVPMTTPQSGSYCMSSKSQSTTTFYYDSAAGGLSTNACL